MLPFGRDRRSVESGVFSKGVWSILTPHSKLCRLPQGSSRREARFISREKKYAEKLFSGVPAHEISVQSIKFLPKADSPMTDFPEMTAQEPADFLGPFTYYKEISRKDTKLPSPQRFLNT